MGLEVAAWECPAAAAASSAVRDQAEVVACNTTDVFEDRRSTPADSVNRRAAAAADTATRPASVRETRAGADWLP